MATSYLVATELELKRQEGDTGSIVFTVPAAIDLATYSTVAFQVKKANKVAVMSKATGGSGITVLAQVITVALDAVDTKGVPGVHRWELQVTDGTEIITIGKGNFVIIKELIT